MSSQQDVSNRLISAISGGHLETARELINSFGLSFSKTWSDGYTLLLDAALMNHTAVAELLLISGSPVNSSYYKPADTPLHFAALHGNIHIVKMLLNKGANVNTKNEDGKTPLFNVINNLDNGNEHDKLEVAELLLKHRADVNARDNSGISPLHIAIVKCLKIVKILLDYGAYINCTTFADVRVQPYVSKGYAPLHYAVECNLKEVITFLLSRGADIDVKTENGISPLHIAAKKGYTHIAEELLSHDACINCLTLEERFTPLHIASEQGCEEIVKLLLNRGADVNAITKNILTPLYFAVKRRDIAIINLLLKHGAKVDYNDENGKTILQYAVEDGCLMIVESILKYCPEINNQCKRRSLKTAVYGYKREKNIQALREYGFYIHPGDVNAEYFHSAVREGHLKIVEDLLKYGINVNVLYYATSEEGGFTRDINARDKSGKTPIAYAIQNWDLKMTKLLLSNKANINDNQNLLSNAVREECIEIVEALLQHGADTDCSDKYGRTPLHFTVLMEHERYNLKELRNDSYYSESLDKRGKMAELLLSKGANVNARTKNGITTLCAAIKKGCAKVIEALLKYNADLNSVVISDVLPLHLAVEIGNEELIILLLNKGADVNAKGKDGITSLHIAVEECGNEVVKILLEYGANVNSKSHDDITPLCLAAKKGNEKVVETLLKFGANINYEVCPYRTALRFASDYRHEKVLETLLDYGADIGDVFDSSSQVMTPFQNHIIKLKKANLYVSEQNLRLIGRNYRMENYEDKCEKEIEKMKSEKINITKISFYDILVRDTSSLVKYMRNKNVVQILKAGDYTSKFPIYARMIKSYFRKMMKRKVLLDQVNEIIYFVFNNLPELPDDCTDKILSYLSNEDLRIIMDACNKPLSIINHNLIS